MVIISNGSDRLGCVRADSSCATKRMFGRDSGLARVHAKAALTTKTTASANSSVGEGSLLSNKSFKSNSELFGNVFADADTASNKSIGCFPIMTSNATTPKLYTSDFVVTLIVCASSVDPDNKNSQF